MSVVNPDDLWQELLAAEQSVVSGGSPAHSVQAIDRLKQQVKPGGTSGGDAHAVSVLRARIADVVAHIGYDGWAS